jgi:putative hydrolase of the HAD superfamily
VVDDIVLRIELVVTMTDSIEPIKCQPNEIIFIGDDYENDYIVPRRMGMSSIWLNKGQPKRREDDTIIDFNELKTILLG